MIPLLERPQDSLFWTAAEDEAGDFAPEDPLALDYLGQQVGLWLLPALTTRTSRAQNYAVVAYGLHLAELGLREYGQPDTDEGREVLFRRWERFWAMSVLEYHGGPLERGHSDAMRGVRGAGRAWRATGPVPLDYRLIDRQSELGSLGAYLSSLRACDLVFPGTLRITPVARDVVDAFWAEGGSRLQVEYERYALEALDPARQTIARRHQRLTLWRVGQRSRLGVLVGEGRREQQDRLWRLLFEEARDPVTLPLSELVRRAARRGPIGPRELIEGALADAFGPVPDAVRERLTLALAFGQAVEGILTVFNAVYGAAIEDRAWRCPLSIAATAIAPRSGLKSLQRACGRLLEAPGVDDFRELRLHGRPFLSLAHQLRDANPEQAVARILENHRSVQVERGRAPWLRLEEGQVLLELASYNGYQLPARFPTFKIDVVQSLLRDMGRIA